MNKKENEHRFNENTEICQKIFKKVLTYRQKSSKILSIKSVKRLRKKELAMFPEIITTQAAVRTDVPLSPRKSANIVNATQVCDAVRNVDACSRRIKMIKTTDAVEYLIGLYKNTTNSEGKHYACSNVKLGKLLTLASFLQACTSDNNDTQLLDENIIALDCGMTINNIDYIILGYHGEVEECDVINPAYISDVQCGLGIVHKNLLRFVFENFGAFPQRKIGLYLNEYKPDGIKMYDIVTIDSKLIGKLQGVSINSSVYKLNSFSEYIERYRTQTDGNRSAEGSY